MNRHERIQAALKGKAVDRMPVSAWGHFFHKENTAEGLADAMLAFQEQYDWDFMKINSRACYHAEGWGYTYHQSGKPGERPVCTGYPLRRVEDWKKLKPLPPNQGALAEHLNAVELIREGLRGRVPFIMTVFSPLMVAGFLVGGGDNGRTSKVKRHINEDPFAVSQGLAAIAETFANFVRELAGKGVDGIFFPTTWANDGMLTAKEYHELARPHDMTVLEEARQFPFNMLHLCRHPIHLTAMADYPVHAINWDIHAGENPGLSEGKRKISAAVVGGIDRNLLAEGSAEEIKSQVRQALIQTDARHHLLTPGCAVDLAKTAESNFRALRGAAEEGF